MLRATVLLACAVVSACGSNGSTPEGTMVSGTVRYNNSSPAQSVTVVITDAKGTKTSVMTSATGSFSLLVAATPYSAAVADSSTAIVYSGLTRTDPVLTLSSSGPLPNRGATLVVALDGGSYPQPSNDYATNFLFVSPLIEDVFALTGPLTSINSLAIGWANTSTSTTGTLYGLQVQTDDSGRPISYLGFGAASVSAADKTTTNTPMTLEPVTAAQLTGTLTVPSGYTLVEMDGLLSFGAQPLGMPFFSDSAPSTSFSYSVPSVTGTTVVASAFAVGPGQAFWEPSWVGPAGEGTGVALDCPVGPSLISPTGNQADVTTATPFSWAGTPGAVYRLVLNEVSVWTAETTITAPDLSALGITALPPGTTLAWQVYSFAPVSGVDAVAAPTGLSTGGVLCAASSPLQEFTTSASP